MSAEGPPAGGCLAALPSLKEVIARHEFRAKHSLGQHFLLDLNLTAKIASIAGRPRQAGTSSKWGRGRAA